MKAQTKPTASGCDICGSTSARELYTAKDRLSNSGEAFSIGECPGCGVLRTLPALDDAELARYYTGDYWGAAEEPSQEWIESSQSEKTRFLARCRLARGTILDVGCGAGFFLRALGSSHWDRFGVEISEAACATATRALGAGRVFTGGLKQSGLQDSVFDVVTFWSALEHTNEPRANLNEARRIIKHGGSLIVQVPNASSYQARWFGGAWFALDAPRHRYHFNPGILDRILKETGFRIYRISYSSKTHNAHALKQSLKLKLASEHSNAAGLALFYLALPFIRPFDSVMSLLGKGATLTVAARAI